MAVKTGGGFGVFEFGVREDFPAQARELGVILQQLHAGVHIVVVVIILAVVVEPRLHAFGEVFVVVDAGVFAFPQPVLHGRVVGLFDTVVEGGIHVVQSAQMNVVGELVNENIFLLIRIARIAEHVFLGAGAAGIGDTAAGAAGTGVPEIFAGKGFKIGHWLIAHASEFRQISGEFIVGHDAEACAAQGHCFQDVGALGEHQVTDECGLLERVGVHFLRSHDGKATQPFDLSVERRNAIFSCRRVETERLMSYF